MKNTLILLLFAYCAFYPTAAFAQAWEPPQSFKEMYAYGCDPDASDYATQPSCGVVIALSGLKLRATPSFSAKTLAVIPFAETVWRTETGYRLKPTNWNEQLMTPDSIIGYWQEITWKGKQGFAFSAFIGNAIHRMTDPAYLLFESQWNCWNDCYASPAYHYYGLVPNPDSSRWHLKKIKPSFVFNEDDFAGITIRSGLKQAPFCILASSRPLQEGLLMAGKTNSLVFDVDIHQADMPVISKKVKIPTSQFVLSVQSKPGTEGRTIRNLILTEKSTGRTQTLVAEFYVSKIELIWSGDIDSDGIMDIMLAYSSDESYGCQLFLSGAAKGKELLKPLRIYWYGDCC